jgi:tRNA threonylcarbamoyladenosine biosynthesis protein TsaE
MERTIRSVSELEVFAREFIASLSSRDDRATFIGLSGDLGSGKTAFVKAVAKVLGVHEEITSPTFVIEKRYALPVGNVFTTLIHIDAYRLNNGTELKPLKWEETLANPTHLIFLEWPEQVSDAIPADGSTLQFLHVDNATRQISL